MCEQTKPGVDPGHRCVELDVVVFQSDRVVLEGFHPVQQERVHHVVLGPVVVVDQTDDGRKGAAECCCGGRVTIGQRCRGGDKALAVGTHRLVHRHQNAVVFGNRDELGAAHVGFSHAAPPRCSSGLELLACHGRSVYTGTFLENCEPTRRIYLPRTWGNRGGEPEPNDRTPAYDHTLWMLKQTRSPSYAPG